MGDDKIEELQEFLKNQPTFLMKDAEALQRAADERGSWNENPEEDGYWISPDRKIIEMFYNWDLDDAEHHDWIRTARKRASARKQRDSKGVNDDKTEEPQDFQKPVEASPLKEQTEPLQKSPNKDGSPNENPEALTTIDIAELDPSNFNWLREARKVREANKRAPRDVDENTDR